MVRRPIKFTSVNNDVSRRSMNYIDVSNYEYVNEVNTFDESISDAIYECVRESRDLVYRGAPC